uniref:Uncharacterized protein n=1 Tax=Bionectria ochroleuca TaxID=29856 RepID=A0A8H7N9A0_BIOOC
MPVYTSLGMPRTMEERERHRIFLLRTREAQMREAQMREAEESPSRSPVEREDILDTPPPRAPSDMDPTVQTPRHSHFHREDMMATPPPQHFVLQHSKGPALLLCLSRIQTFHAQDPWVEMVLGAREQTHLRKQYRQTPDPHTRIRCRTFLCWRISPSTRIPS